MKILPEACFSDSVGDFWGIVPAPRAALLEKGRWDALWGILGMIVGAGLYAEIYPFLMKNVLNWGNFGYLSIPQLIGINRWWVIIVFVTGTLALFRWFEKKGSLDK